MHLFNSKLGGKFKAVWEYAVLEYLLKLRVFLVVPEPKNDIEREVLSQKTMYINPS